MGTSNESKRIITFTRRLPGSKWRHVEVALDPGDTIRDALDVLKAHARDWTVYTLGSDVDSLEWAYFQIQKRDAAFGIPKDVLLPVPPQEKPIQFGPYTPHAVDDDEHNIPHNWGTGWDDTFDHLDRETKWTLQQCIAAEESAIEESLSWDE